MTLTRTLILTVSSLIISASTAQWLPANSGLQSIRSITVHEGNVYVASYPYGIYRTTDGVTWEPMNTGLPVVIVDEIEFIYAESVASNGSFLMAGTSSGVYRSADDGATWTLANGPLTASTSIYANKWFRTGNSILAIFSGSIANGGGIFATNNNGTTWVQGANGMSTNMTVYHIAAIDGALYAATSGGLFRSVNNAQNWQLVAGSNFSMYGIQGTASRWVCISDFGYRYLNPQDPNPTWSNGTGAPAVSNTAQLILYNSIYYAISGNNAGVYRSMNQGVSWQPYNIGLNEFDAISQEEFHANGENLYLGALFDLYNIEGTTLAVTDEASTREASIYPTVFSDGFTVEVGPEAAGATLLLIDAMGREVLQQGMSGVDKVRVERGALESGAYHVMLMPKNGGQASHLGTVIAD
jgi:hypothetical protein